MKTHVIIRREFKPRTKTKKYLFICAVMPTLCQIGLSVTLTDGINLGPGNTVPTGSNSATIGEGNNVSNSSIAVGNYNIADNYSLAIGDQSKADWGSIAVGYINTVDSNSYYSILGGEGNYSGYSGSSVLFGLYNSMGLQTGSAAIGNSNTMLFPFGKLGFGNILMGQFNQIDATVSSAPNEIQGNVILGTSNKSSESMAFAIGIGNIGQTETVTIGTFAQPVSSASLIVGTGYNQSNRSNGLVVLKNGQVQIPGALIAGGYPVLNQGSAPSYLQNLGFVNASYLATNGYIRKSTGTNSSVGANGLLALGDNAHATENSSLAIGNGANALSGGAISLGESSVASASCAMAFQGGVAEGEHSLATSWGYAGGKYSLGMAAGWAFADTAVAIGGYDETANWANEAIGVGSTSVGGATNSAIGDYSYAMGRNSVSVGQHSYSIGFNTRTNAYQVSMGFQNLSSQNQMPDMSNDQWQEGGALFELGNGNPSLSGPAEASNAITTLKNGQTTLTNKEWKVHQSTPLADPASNTDSGGEALVVEGHTRLKGKVIIEQPQGDISMGIYGAN